VCFVFVLQALHALLILPASSSAIKPHVQCARDLASTAAGEAKKVAGTAAVEAKKVAEEALVLGVRGYSYAHDQWVRVQSPQPATPSVPQPEKQPFYKKAAEEAIVLGVRGYSYAQDQFGRLACPPDVEPIKVAILIVCCHWC
jgi:hypothetical protein